NNLRFKEFINLSYNIIMKSKIEKNKQSYDVVTLDDVHKKHVEEFKKKKTLLPKYKNKLNQMKKELDELNNKNPSEYTTDDTKKKAVLITQIQEINEEINDIDNNISEIDYYYKTEDIILNYYNILNQDDHVLYDNNPELNKKKEETNNNEIISDQLGLFNK